MAAAAMPSLSIHDLMAVKEDLYRYTEKNIAFCATECKGHAPPTGAHYTQERPSRVIDCWAFVRKHAVHSKLLMVKRRQVTDDEILSVHTEEHVAYIGAMVSQEPFYQNPHVYFTAHTDAAAREACAGACDVMEVVMSRRCQYGFALVRPPGHHAGLRPRDPSLHDTGTHYASGGCFYNSVAIALMQGRIRKHFQRAAIIDLDVHHGDGTEEIFKDDPDVLLVNIHVANSFPRGTGNVETTGSYGTNVNIPWVEIGSMAGDLDYEYLFHFVIIPLVREFSPEVILLSAGFDAEMQERYGAGMTAQGYTTITRLLKRSFLNLPIVGVLEGGYGPQLASCVVSVLKTLAEESDEDEEERYEAPVMNGICHRTVHRVVATHARFWRCLEFRSHLLDAFFRNSEGIVYALIKGDVLPRNVARVDYCNESAEATAKWEKFELIEDDVSRMEKMLLPGEHAKKKRKSASASRHRRLDV